MWLIGIEKVKYAIEVYWLADVGVGRTLLGGSKLLLPVLVRVSTSLLQSCTTSVHQLQLKGGSRAPWLGSVAEMACLAQGIALVHPDSS